MKNARRAAQRKCLDAFLKACLLLVFAAALISCAAQHEIRILYINDFHGFAAPYRPYGSTDAKGGLAYLAALAERLRAEKPTIFLAAGDMIQGNNWANLFQGKSSIEALNSMNLDAMVVGNHEFDFGQSILKERIKEAKFPVLGANVLGFSELKPYIIKDFDGLSVAVIGIVTDETPVSTNPRNVEGLQFISPIDTADKYVRKLKGSGDIIVVLSHIGFTGDVELAKKVDGIDVIVGGHSHTKVDKPVAIGNTLIVQAFEHGKVLGVLDIAVNNGKVIRADGRLEPITPKGEENKEVAAIVAKYQQRIEALMGETIGETLVDLDGANVRQEETNLGNLIADIMKNTSGADAAVINGGTIRTSIGKGKIRVSDIYDVLPFDNYLVAIRLTGQQIRDIIEHGVSGIEEGKGGFLQVSGIEFTYDESGKKGYRVKEILIGKTPLEADKKYTVATNDFLVAGGDGFKAFGDALKSSKDYALTGGIMKGENITYCDSGRWLRDVVIDFIKSKKVISPKVEGRIHKQKKTQ